MLQGSQCREVCIVVTVHHIYMTVIVSVLADQLTT